MQIAETYSFLPREAVTRFLMACSECQKRMHLSMNENNNNHKTKTSVNKEQCNSSKNSNNEAQATTNSTLLHHRPLYQHPAAADPSLIDYSLPITTTYLNHLRAKGEPTHPDMSFFCHDKDVSKINVITARKRSLGQGNVFTHSVHRRVGGLPRGGEWADSPSPTNQKSGRYAPYWKVFLLHYITTSR